MIFRLFKEISFEIADPIALIEAFCFQSDFYANYDIVPVAERKIQHVNKIGARIDEKLLSKFQNVIENTKKLRIFTYDDNLDRFFNLRKVEEMNEIIREFNDHAVKALLGKGVGLSKATKTLHTFHPETVPMIDNPLQRLYKEKVKPNWAPKDPQIFIDYYGNLKEGNTWKNLNTISTELSKGNLHLTRVRILDILWWSCLKSRNLNAELKKKRRNTVEWLTVHVENSE